MSEGKKQYDNTNQVVLWENDKRGNAARPDFTGFLNVEGVEYKISVWGKDGAKGYMLKGKVELKVAKPSGTVDVGGGRAQPGGGWVMKNEAPAPRVAEKNVTPGKDVTGWEDEEPPF